MLLRSRAAIAAQGAIIGFVMPKLAQDQKFDPTPLLAGVTGRNFTAKIPAIIAGIKKATRGKLAFDASEEELRELLEELSGDPAIDDGEFANTHQGRVSVDEDDPAPEAGPLLTEEQVKDILRYCAEELNIDEEKLSAIGERLLQDTVAEDEPAPFSGRPRPSGEMEPIIAEDAAVKRRARTLAYDTRQRAQVLAADSFSRMFPSAPKEFVAMPSDYDHSCQRPVRIDPTAQATFDKLFPTAGKLKVIP